MTSQELADDKSKAVSMIPLEHYEISVTLNVHIFWLGLWVTVFKDTLALPTVVAIPCIAVVTFICCFVTTKIISFIPGSKWIVG